MGGDGVRAIGVHGIGGSGKSTLSKLMVNFYGSEFLGRCLYLEFPTLSGEDDNVAKLLQSMKSIFSNISDIHEAMLLLEERVKKEIVFLVIDNVWDDIFKSKCPCFQYAEKIMQMVHCEGSKIMVTSRSESIVRNLLRSKLGEHEIMRRKLCNLSNPPVVPVPSLSEEEAVQSLKSSCPFSSLIPEECLWKLARSCFFEKQCHPLYLNLKGVELKQKGRATFNTQHWQDLISSLEVVHNTNNMEHENFDMTPTERSVFNIVEKSLDTLPSRRLQEIFINLVTFHDSRLNYYGQPYEPPWRFLQFYYDEWRTKEKMFHEVILVLEYHGLLELRSTEFAGCYTCDWEQYQVVIHDLHKLVAASRVNSLSNIEVLAKSSLHVKAGLSPVKTAQEVLNKRHVVVADISASIWSLLFERYSNQVQTQFLKIEGYAGFSPPPKLSLITNEWKALRRLELYSIFTVEEITGWEGTPNLARLYLTSMYSLRNIGNIGCLKRLQWIHFDGCPELEVRSIVGSGAELNELGASSLYLVKSGDQLPELEHLQIVDSCKKLAEVGDVCGTFPSLTTLELESCDVERLPAELNLGKLLALQFKSCPKLRSIGKRGSSFSSLRELRILNCPNLECIPDISNSTNLESLELESCQKLSSICKGGSSFSSFRKLSIIDCPNLECIPDVSNSTNLSWLKLKRCQNLRRIGKGGSSFPFLTSLSIDNCPNLECIPDLSNSKPLMHLSISDCPNLEVPDLSHSTNLQILELEKCPKLRRISKGGSSLSSLTFHSISDCPNLECNPDLSTSTSLWFLSISDCHNLECIPDLSNLTSLEYLCIYDCPNLVCIPDPINSRNLQFLKIWNWASLRSASAADCRRGAHVDIFGSSNSTDEESLGVAANANLPVSIVSQLHAGAANATVTCDHHRRYNLESEIRSGYKSYVKIYTKGYKSYVTIQDESSAEGIRLEVVRVAVRLQDLRCRAPVFEHLTDLWLDVEFRSNGRMLHGGAKIRWLDVCGMPNLEELYLANFEWVQKLSFPTCLVNFRFLSLKNLPSLEEIRAPWCLAQSSDPGRSCQFEANECPSLVKWVVYIEDVDGPPDELEI